MIQPMAIRSERIYQREKPVRDPLYTRWLKRFPCVVCGTNRNIDPCHSGPHALGQKGSDAKCIPLCRSHHIEFDAAPADFVVVHDLDIPALIAMFNHLWELKMKRTA